MKSLIHIFLMAAMLFSTMGVSISKHYCQEQVAGVSIFGKKKSCCEGKRSMPPGCCRDETEFHQLDDDFAPAVLDFRLLPPQLSLLHTVHDFSLPVGSGTGEPEYLNYKPPILHADLLVWVQTFRI